MNKNLFVTLEILGLDKYLKYLYKSENITKTWINNPYHNLYHTFTVTFYCWLYSERLQMNEESLRNIKNIKNLLLAALFHDVDHSGGESSDSHNVLMAKRALMEALNAEGELDRYEEIADIINATQFPYIIDDKDLTLSQKIIRDADLSQSFEVETFEQHNLLGLAKEMNQTLLESVRGTRKFWEGRKMYTIPGQHMLDRVKPFMDSTLNLLEKQLN